MKQLLAVLVLLASLVVAGCASDTPAGAQVSDAGANTIDGDGSPEPDVNESSMEATNESNVGVPDIQIMSVTLTDTDLEFIIKNSGDAPADDVYIGMVGLYLYPVYEMSAIDEEDYDWSNDFENAIVEAVKGEGDKISTGYMAYGPKSNKPEEFTIESQFIQRSYIGAIGAGESVTGHITARVYHYDEYIEVAWMDDDEEHLAYYY